MAPVSVVLLRSSPPGGQFADDPRPNASTKTNEQYQSLLASPVYRKLQQDIGRMVATSEIHNSVAFNGHLQKDLI